MLTISTPRNWKCFMYVRSENRKKPGQEPPPQALQPLGICREVLYVASRRMPRSSRLTCHSTCPGSRPSTARVVVRANVVGASFRSGTTTKDRRVAAQQLSPSHQAHNEGFQGCVHSPSWWGFDDPTALVGFLLEDVGLGSAQQELQSRQCLPRIRNVPGKLDHAPTGRVTREEIDYCRQDVVRLCRAAQCAAA